MPGNAKLRQRRQANSKPGGTAASAGVSAEVVEKLEGAATLLLAGKRRLSNGRLTYTNVAIEAEVGRATANRAKAVQKWWKDELKNLRAKQEATHPDVEAERLRRELAEVKADALKEIMGLRKRVSALAQEVQGLARLYARERDAHKRLKTQMLAELSCAPDDDVLPIARSRRRKP